MRLAPGKVKRLLAYERNLSSFQWDRLCEFINLGSRATETEQTEQLVTLSLKLLSAYAAISFMRI